MGQVVFDSWYTRNWFPVLWFCHQMLRQSSCPIAPMREHPLGWHHCCVWMQSDAIWMAPQTFTSFYQTHLCSGALCSATLSPDVLFKARQCPLAPKSTEFKVPSIKGQVLWMWNVQAGSTCGCGANSLQCPKSFSLALFMNQAWWFVFFHSFLPRQEQLQLFIANSPP